MFAAPRRSGAREDRAADCEGRYLCAPTMHRGCARLGQQEDLLNGGGVGVPRVCVHARARQGVGKPQESQGECSWNIIHSEDPQR